MNLYIVPTPIGNLKDITFRAIEILKNVDIILAEDTRKTKILLNHYSISTPLESFHKFNEHQKSESLINRIKSGQEIALVSDAGTPGISDPGYLIIRDAVQNEIPVITLPGATAFVPALVNSGLPCDRFIFEGFLPQKKGRQKRMQELAEEPRTIVLYESPHRIEKFLDEIEKYFGQERIIAISRELSKIYEENLRGTVVELKSHFQKNKPKGEFVVIIQGKEKKQKSE